MKFSHNEQIASEMGYKVINGVVYKPNGEEQKVCICTRYPAFNLRIGCKKHVHVNVHRLVAYQKFGNRIYKKGLDVRHLDGDKLNFSKDNIDIGTRRQNYMDIPEKERKRITKNLYLTNIKYTDEDIKEMYRQRIRLKYTYQKIADNFNIYSYASVYYALLRKYTREALNITVRGVKYSDELARQIRKERFELGYSYKQIMGLHGISCKGSLYNILYKRKLPEDTLNIQTASSVANEQTYFEFN